MTEAIPAGPARPGTLATAPPRGRTAGGATPRRHQRRGSTGQVRGVVSAQDRLGYDTDDAYVPFHQFY